RNLRKTARDRRALERLVFDGLTGATTEPCHPEPTELTVAIEDEHGLGWRRRNGSHIMHKSSCSRGGTCGAILAVKNLVRHPVDLPGRNLCTTVGSVHGLTQSS